MTEQINLVPKRRFKEFQNTHAWEQRKFEDEVEFYSGLTYSPADVVDNGGTLVLRSSNVKDGEIVNADNVYVSSEVVNSDNVKIGDVIVVVRNGSRSLIGKHAQIKEKMNNTVIGAFMTGVRSEQSAFINALLNTSQFDKEIEKNMGATINQITTGAFKKMQFMFPHREEQKKLGEFFKHLDNLITLHQRKLEKTKALKSAYLSEMFPAEGEREPKRRFAGFTQAWEQRKLGEVLKINSGRDYKHLNEGDIPVYGTGGYMLSVDDKLSDVDGIGIGRKGTIDKPQYLKAPFWTVDTLFFMTPMVNYDLQFLFSMSQNIKWKQMDESTGVPSLSKTVIEGIYRSFPSYKEQVKIGSFFKQLDETIDLHQRKLEKLQNIKKAYLNEMFV